VKNKTSRGLWCILTTVSVLAMFLTASAEEGMFLIGELDPNLMAKMKALGARISLGDIYNPEGTGLANAVINIGGTASFVSSQGLIITAHHVALRAVRKIHAPGKNYVHDGFIARSRNEEIPAPGMRALVLLSVVDVTKRVLSGIPGSLVDLEYVDAVEEKKEEILKEENTRASGFDYRLETMNYGMKYYLFTFLKLKDIRIVYVPAIGIGFFGGDTDNYIWPRHCGDFAFLRAYASPDGRPAEYSKNNVPYKPKSFFRVSAKGIKEDDLTLLLGFPQRTTRYLTADALELDQSLRLPLQIKIDTELVRILEDASEAGQDSKELLSPLIARLRDEVVTDGEILRGLSRDKLFARKKAEEDAVLRFAKSNRDLRDFLPSVYARIQAVVHDQKRVAEKALLIHDMDRCSPLLSIASIINKWSIEKQKKDSEREAGYKEADLPAVEQKVRAAQKTMIWEADKKSVEYFLQRIVELPEDQKVALWEDEIRGKNPQRMPGDVGKFVESIYKTSRLASAEERVKWLRLSGEDLLKLNDPLLRFASELEKERELINRKEKELWASYLRLMPDYLRGLVAWKKADLPYFDANGTLRLSYGQVKGYSPRDAVTYGYLTSLRGVFEKYTGVEPFDVPASLSRAYREKDFGDYIDKRIHDIPVNFTSSNDGPGGNSGAAVLNANGELIGVSFDRNIESLDQSYCFNPLISRRLQVDMRYILFVTEKVDKALNVLEELTVARN
jgi:hypothetical protein